MDYLYDSLRRAAKTVAQTAVGYTATAAVITDVDWNVAFSAAALAGLISLLMSVSNLPDDELSD